MVDVDGGIEIGGGPQIDTWSRALKLTREVLCVAAFVADDAALGDEVEALAAAQNMVYEGPILAS